MLVGKRIEPSSKRTSLGRMEFVCRLKRYMAILSFCAARAGLATLGLFAFIAPAYCAEPGQALPVRVALYDVAPYGGQSREGLF